MINLTEKELKRNIYRVAEKRGLEVVEEMVDKIIKGLIANKEKHGDYYCPCQVTEEGTQCPCSTLYEQIKESGMCHCNLYRGNVTQ